MVTNLGKIKVSRKYKSLDTSTLYSFAHGTVFGTTGIGATVPESDLAIYGYADAMMATCQVSQGCWVNPTCFDLV